MVCTSRGETRFAKNRSGPLSAWWPAASPPALGPAGLADAQIRPPRAHRRNRREIVQEAVLRPMPEPEHAQERGCRPARGGSISPETTSADASSTRGSHVAAYGNGADPAAALMCGRADAFHHPRSCQAKVDETLTRVIVTTDVTQDESRSVHSSDGRCAAPAAALDQIPRTRYTCPRSARSAPAGPPDRTAFRACTATIAGRGGGRRPVRRAEAKRTREAS
jgi:hypothetical protein